MAQEHDELENLALDESEDHDDLFVMDEEEEKVKTKQRTSFFTTLAKEQKSANGRTLGTAPISCVASNGITLPSSTPPIPVQTRPEAEKIENDEILPSPRKNNTGL